MRIFENSTEKRLYQTWIDMRRRCYVKNRKNYKHYGLRGISVCDEWNNSFKNFKNWALANGYEDYLTIDRIDVNGNYEPQNCKWSTAAEQNNNRRNNRILEFKGERHTISEWSKITGLNKSTILKRVSIRGWSTRDALSVKDGRKK